MMLQLPPKTFCLIRHGETSANRDGIIAGAHDVDLTDKGRKQAEALRETEWPTATMLFASPKRRAQDTCALAFPDAPFHTQSDLRERDWGIFEGLPITQLPPRDGKPEGGEDWGEMQRRVASAISEGCALAQDLLPIFVCHSGVIRATRILAGQSNVGARPHNAQPIYFEWTGREHKEIYDVE
ncbi:histidine phosphatase family protein [Phaeobacter sp. C3_T13_0]|uniref:histidine phosphatase family protein n=1 Tax=Phaeobacter cretensis TaxID=3342641 RepID=UPI0039BCD3EC